MMHILDVARQQMQEQTMAKKKSVADKPREVAQIVYYLGTDGARVLRYSSMKKASKQFDDLMEAIENGRAFALTGDTSTAYIKDASTISDAFLVDCDLNQDYVVSTQTRFNYLTQQQVPLPG